MPRPSKAVRLAAAMGTLALTAPALAQSITALPDQTSRLKLSNRDINHILCQGGEIEDVKFSAEKAIAVERGGSDAWVKFLVKETDDQGVVTRSYVTTPSEFFVRCNGAVYPLYAEPADIPAQTVILAPGAVQLAKTNANLLAPLVEEDRAVSVTMALLLDHVPASFAEVAPQAADILLPALPALSLHERRRLEIDGAGLSASEYLIGAKAPTTLDERSFLDTALGANIISVTLDRTELGAGDVARLVIVRRGAAR